MEGGRTADPRLSPHFSTSGLSVFLHADRAAGGQIRPQGTHRQTTVNHIEIHIAMLYIDVWGKNPHTNIY